MVRHHRPRRGERGIPEQIHHRHSRPQDATAARARADNQGRTKKCNMPKGIRRGGRGRNQRQVRPHPEKEHQAKRKGAGGVLDLATAAGEVPGANTPCHIDGISAARRKTTGAEQQSGSMQMTPQPDPPRGEAKGAKYKVAGVQTPGGPNGP
jgi:hypothetical protein